jgi:hypothetical protein
MAARRIPDRRRAIGRHAAAIVTAECGFNVPTDRTRLAALLQIVLGRRVEHALPFRADLDRRGLKRRVTKNALNDINGHVSGDGPGTERMPERVGRHRE